LSESKRIQRQAFVASVDAATKPEPWKEPDMDIRMALSDRPEELLGDVHEYPEGEWKVLLVRHGESINNILSQGLDPKRYQQEGEAIFKRKLAKPGATSATQDGILALASVAKEAIDLAKNKIDVNSPGRDSFLSLTGEESANRVKQGLVEAQAKKELDLFGGDDAYQTVYLSPMRRTIATAMNVFGDLANMHSSVKFKVAPWAHEQLKSVSDLAYGRDILKDFAEKYAAEAKLPSDHAFHSIQESLDKLPLEWSTSPEPEGSELTYYPQGKAESYPNLCVRMKKLEEWITTLEEKRIIIVTHGGVMKHLFDMYFQGRQPDNIGMFEGTLVSPGGRNLPFWKDVHSLRTSMGGSSQWMPAFLDPKNDDANWKAPDEVEISKEMCPYHAGILAQAAKEMHMVVQGIRCPSFDKKIVRGSGRSLSERIGCQLREVAITADHAYLVRSENSEFEPILSCMNCVDVGNTKMLGILGTQLRVSNAGAPETPPPSADDPSWVSLGDDPHHNMAKSFMLTRGGKVVLRFRFSADVDQVVHNSFLATLWNSIDQN